ncbi:MAG TPA: DUF2304 domain-containing protein [Acetobacteraceae bacterium]|nr:DUF2304 domain-containing protein [Acetobacteraceae bacterium]
MIMKILLSLGLGFVLFLYLANNRRRSPITLIALLGSGSGLVFVWNPELANRIAEMLGVGRGADLIFYCWVMISIALFLTIHFKLRQMNESLTEFVRETAISEARAKKPTTGEC